MTRDPLALRSESVAEFTFKAIAAGVVLGVLFGAANAYLGLRVGMTVSASIPAAVMAVVVFRALKLRSTILEVNLAQTVGSASTALATGTIFTIPALFLWGMVPPYMQVVALCFLGGLLGISAMIPLRRLLIVDAHAELPYPEGRACAEVLRASESGTSAGVWIFRGMAVGAAVKILISVAYPDAVRDLLSPARSAQGRARARALTGAVRGRLHPRLPPGRRLRRRFDRLVARPHSAPRLDGGAPGRAALPRDRPSGRRHGRRRHLVALRPLHRRRGRGDGGHPHRGAQLPHHAGFVCCGGQGAAEEGLRRIESARRVPDRPRSARRLRLRRHRDRHHRILARPRSLLRRHGPHPEGGLRSRASASSACSSLPSPRASSVSSASRRSRPRASRWSLCSASPRPSPPPAGSTVPPGPRCSPSAPSSRSPLRRRATSPRI